LRDTRPAQYLHSLGQTLDDAQVAHGGVVEYLQRGLIFLTVVGGDRTLHAVELNYHPPPGHPSPPPLKLNPPPAPAAPFLISLRRVAARQKAPARRGDCRPCDLRIGRQ